MGSRVSSSIRTESVSLEIRNCRSSFSRFKRPGEEEEALESLQSHLHRCSRKKRGTGDTGWRQLRASAREVFKSQVGFSASLASVMPSNIRSTQKLPSAPSGTLLSEHVAPSEIQREVRQLPVHPSKHSTH